MAKSQSAARTRVRKPAKSTGTGARRTSPRADKSNDAVKLRSRLFVRFWKSLEQSRSRCPPRAGPRQN